MDRLFAVDANWPPCAAALVVLTSILLAMGTTSAAPVAATDLDGLDLGAKIIGPVGPEVESTFVNASGEGIGDLISSVSCPAGFANCVPPTNPAGTLYTYRHTVTPGVDLPNDPPFPSPDTILPFDGADRFSLGFDAAGFTGLAGYSFSDAADALANGASITIEHVPGNTIEWRLSEDAGWDTGESITFFWQTTQPPSGPGGRYNLGSTQTGAANGPLPAPVSAAPPLALLALGLLGMIGMSHVQQSAR